MKVHILDDWFGTLAGLPSFRKLAGHDVTVHTDHLADEDALAARLSEAEAVALFRERTPFPGSLIRKLPKLKLISLRGSYPHVDVPAATACGVLVASHRPAAAPSQPTAELTMALVLASARQLPAQFASAKAGRWQAGIGRTLQGRTMGLYGYGGIGGLVADLARAFGMRVVWWGSEAGRARAGAAGKTVVASRAAFFAESDFVSVHVKLTPASRGIITADDLLAMQPAATFVNTSRAGLVAPGALEAALAAGRPGTLALDVFDTEPLLDAGDPVLSHPAVIATPHIGYVTEDELDLQFGDIYDQIVAYAAGAPIHMINPEVREL